MVQLKITIFFFLVVAGTVKVNAQNRGAQVKTEFNNLRTKLKMDENRFREFRHNLALFNDSVTHIMNTRDLSSEDRQKRVEAIQANRALHLKKTLSREQYALFGEFEKTLQRTSIQRKRIEGKKV
jgi:hypothetical protein